MLEQLLDELRMGKSWQVVDLAHKLDTTPALVEMMLHDLERMGYVQALRGECPGKCSGCAAAGQCAVGAGMRVWTLSERRAIAPR